MFNFPVRVPHFLKWLFPGYIWDNCSKTSGEKVLYLTFDDGPDPDVTPWVLDQLKKYGAKATFFLVGNNIDRNPELAAEIIRQNHAVGNHTYDHLNGWSTPLDLYVENIKKAEKSINKYLKGQNGQNNLFFRPPYGKIKRNQASKLQAIGFKIVMYDVLARDWDQGLDGERCFKNVTKNAKSGSIVVFHDSLKADKNLKISLPQVLEYYAKHGYTFMTL